MSRNDRSVLSYHKQSDPEKETARRLASSLEPWRYIIPPGPILEVGAGTGHFSEHLAEIFPNRKIEVTDRSGDMVRFSKDRLESKTHLSFDVLDVEKDAIEEKAYSLICGNQLVHQLSQPARRLEILAKSLKIDGVMLMAFPGEDSFNEWRSTCLDLGIPYTAGDLPETEPLVIHLSMGPVQVDFYEDQSAYYYEGIQQYLNHAKNGGLDLQKSDRKLTDREIDLLNQNWKQKDGDSVRLTYHNVFLAVKRIGD